MTRKNIRSVIVDDEPLAIKALEDTLKDFQEIKVVKTCKNGFEALKAIKKERPDLLFLDIKMPEINGFDILDLLEDEEVFVVFVTAYDEYAIRAFEKNAVDYILKPVNRRRLAITIQRVKEKIATSTSQPLRALSAGHKMAQAPISRVMVKVGSNAYVLPVDDIFCFEAADDYVRIHHRGEKSFLKYDTLSSLESLLDPAVFCRIHRSFIININGLLKISPYGKDRHIAVLKNKMKIPVSKGGYKKLQSLLH